MADPFEVVVLGPESSPEQCLRGLLQLVLQKTAKQIECAIEVISEKYGHSKEELCEVVRDAPKMRALLEESLFPSVNAAPAAQAAYAPHAPVVTKGGKKVLIRKKAVKSVAKEDAPPSE